MSRLLGKAYLTLIYLFLYIPIGVVIFFSFNSSTHSLVWHQFTWHWYAVLFQDHDLGVIALHSLVLAVLASTLSTLIGLVAAVSFYRYQFFSKSFWYLLIFILIILPDLVIGIALLLMYTFMDFPLGFFSLLLAHITFCLPYACVTISNQLRQLNKYILEAGKDLGASEWHLFTKIIVPLVWTGLLASWLLGFTLSIDDVIISYFVSGPSFEILPLKIFSAVKLGVSPEINALCTVLVFLTFVLVLVSQILSKRKA